MRQLIRQKKTFVILSVVASWETEKTNKDQELNSTVTDLKNDDKHVISEYRLYK